ncbi:MAG TPA: FkbM family methyltransferase [Gaiellaceae bacterium]|nr:FkbM family methyltransferase [Gaiellaceae bacterium]
MTDASGESSIASWQNLSEAAAERLPPRAVRLLARAVASRPNRAEQPGWFFDISEEDHSRRTTLRRVIWHAFMDRSIEDPVVVPWYDGLRLRLYFGNDLSKCVYVGGSFEPNEFAFLRRYLREGMTFIDVGANEGVYTLFAAKHVGHSGRVIAIEPSERELGRLRANLELNRLRRVTVVEAAVGSSDGRVSLAIAEAKHAGQNTVGTSVANAKVATERIEQVAVRSLDSLVDEERLHRLDFVKVDAEGSELDVLVGARDTLARLRPVLQLEIEPDSLAARSTSPSHITAFIAEHGYGFWAFDEASGRPRRAVGADVSGNVLAAPSEWSPP